jgi:Tfp pilus assembly protein PilF
MPKRRPRAAAPLPEESGSAVAVVPLWQILVAALLLMAATLAAYAPALHGQFLWDDSTWLTDRSSTLLLQGKHGLSRMWSEIGALQQYFPVTGTSFWIEHRLWGSHPFPYHVDNVLLHAGAALLFGVFLARLKVPGAWLAAALFALHPAMVESVAWLTERKNTLSGFLFMAALLSYAHAVSWWDQSGPRMRRAAYAFAVICFALALLAKSSVVVLPPALLLIAWWRKDSLRWRADVLPVLPFFVMAIAAGLLGVWLEKHRVGAEGPQWDLTLGQRFLVAVRVPWFYAGKLLWPADLCAVYPKWHLPDATWLQGLYAVAGGIALGLLWRFRSRIGRGPLAAVAFFLAALFPVMGFFNVYGMLHSCVTDRWAYLPSFGLIALASAGIALVSRRVGRGLVLPNVGIPLLAVMGCLTWSSAARFKDEMSLWRSTIATNPRAWLAHYGLAFQLNRSGQWEEALQSYERAREISPDNPDILTDLGSLLRAHGRGREGRELLERAVTKNPDHAIARNNLALDYMDSGELTAAIEQLERAVQLDPESFQAWSNLGNAQLRSNHGKEALKCYEAALRIAPGSGEVRTNYGAALAQEGRLEDALQQLEEALRLNPGDKDVINNLQWVLRKFGRGAELDVIVKKAGESPPK